MEKQEFSFDFINNNNPDYLRTYPTEMDFYTDLYSKFITDFNKILTKSKAKIFLNFLKSENIFDLKTTEQVLKLERLLKINYTPLENNTITRRTIFYSFDKKTVYFYEQ